MQIQMVVFSEPKAGHAPGEWEDCACGGVVSDAAPGQLPKCARFVVVDGATEAYDSLRWVDQLVTSFAQQPEAAAAPGLEPGAMRAWFARMQDQWARESPAAFDSIIEERKFTEVGSFATLLGCELSGLDGPEPSWKAVALGDTVLFHLRHGNLLATFPPLGPDDFGTRPDGVSTLRSRLDRMSGQLLFGSGSVAPGDFLFAATDAMAHWIIRAIARGEEKVWTVLASLAHPSVFARLVGDHRKAQNSDERMKNDDVTLLRLRVLADQPAFLLRCL
jgi:hypothetical protein